MIVVRADAIFGRADAIIAKPQAIFGRADAIFPKARTIVVRADAIVVRADAIFVRADAIFVRPHALSVRHHPGMRVLARRAFSAELGAALLLGALPVAARAEAPLPALPLAVAVALEGGHPVRDDAWIDAQIAEAERLFEAAAVHFRKTAQRPVAERFAHLETREDRDALDVERRKGVINVFVVASLRDVDDPRLERRGVHWRNRATPFHRYVIVAAGAPPTVLAHELGHYLGLAHTPVVDNLMSYNRTGAQVFLDAHQVAAVRSSARVALGTGELLPAPADAKTAPMGETPRPLRCPAQPVPVTPG